jgi:hypothetical protein
MQLKQNAYFKRCPRRQPDFFYITAVVGRRSDDKLAAKHQLLLEFKVST